MIHRIQRSSADHFVYSATMKTWFDRRYEVLSIAFHINSLEKNKFSDEL